jgi:hypothetical protein
MTSAFAFTLTWMKDLQCGISDEARKPGGAGSSKCFVQ